MKKRKNIFATPKSPYDEWFDLFDDWDTIEASFAADYHIRLRNEEDMKWGEFVSLLKGLSAESPLGRLISIRRENDKNILKSFTPAQHAARNEWRLHQQRKATENSSFVESRIEEFELFCMNVFQNKTL